MAAERFFTKLTNEVLEATEQVATRLEESLTLVFGGNVAKTPAEFSDAPTHEDVGDLEGALRDNPLQGMADSVLGKILDSQIGPLTPMENFHAFRSAITWSEPFIVALVAVQVGMLALSVYVSRRDHGLSPRLAMMAIIAVTVKSSEYLNRLAAQNWDAFCTQNYFDARGVFMSVMVCAPLLLDSLLMLLFFLREASQLLVRVKTMQLKKQYRGRDNDNKKKHR